MDHRDGRRPPATPWVPWALGRHDALWGVAVVLLSVGMFVVTPLLGILRKAGMIELDLVWVFAPAIACVAAVFLHGVSELVRSLR